MTREEFRTSEHCNVLALFLQSPTGKEVLAILRKEAEPAKAKDAQQMASGQDFVMQLALSHNYRIAQFETINGLANLAEPKTVPAPVPPDQGFDLEDEEADFAKKPST